MPKASKHKGKKKITSRGTSTAYTIARLRRDGKVEILDRLMRNEISAQKARQLAGYEEKKIIISCNKSDTPEIISAKLRSKFDYDTLYRVAIDLIAHISHQEDYTEKIQSQSKRTKASFLSSTGPRDFFDSIEPK